MKKLFLKEDRYLDNIQSINLESVTVEEPKYSLTISSREFNVLKELPNEESKVLGFCEVVRKEGKRIKSKKNKVLYLIDYKAPVKVKKKLLEKVIGYVKVEGFENSYIALVKKRWLIPILLWVSTAIIVGILSFHGGKQLIDNLKETVQEVVDHSSDKGTGEFVVEEYDWGEQIIFRTKLSQTPTIKNGKISIKLESPQKENEGKKFVAEIYLLSEVEDVLGENIIETYKEPILIYTSPEIFANENVEWGTLDKEVKAGRYMGVIIQYIFDLDGNYLGLRQSILSILAE